MIHDLKSGTYITRAVCSWLILFYGSFILEKQS